MVVLDEADTMFDAGFGSEVRALLRPLRSKAQPAACVLVAATLSKVSRSLPAGDASDVQLAGQNVSLHGMPQSQHACAGRLSALWAVERKAVICFSWRTALASRSK